jgi:hypothetical protein
MKNSAILAIASADSIGNCTFSVTFDHRVTEGRTVGRFLNELKSRIESYNNLPTRKKLTDIACSKCHKTLEEDISRIGFVKCITLNAEEGYLCQSCIQGF